METSPVGGSESAATGAASAGNFAAEAAGASEGFSAGTAEDSGPEAPAGLDAVA